MLTGVRVEQVARNISKWNNKQTELAKPKPVNPDGPPAGLPDAEISQAVLFLGLSQTELDVDIVDIL